MQESLFIDIKGNPTTDETQGVAKRIPLDNHGVGFFIKWAESGPHKGHPLNPYGLYYRPGDEKIFLPAIGKAMYDYRKVTQAAFDLYVKFLQTKRQGYCWAVEREVLNG